MKKLNNNGITLMALVITIIILIILASIGTYSGVQVVKSARFTAFSTELKIMQTQVNKLYEDKKNDNTFNEPGTIITGKVKEQADKVFTESASGIINSDDYKYYDTDTIKSLNIEGVEGEFLVNIDKRSVVSYEGFEYEGKTYYTLNQLPDSLYNVEYNNTNNWDSSKDSFDIEYNEVEEGKYRITVSNIDYKSGNINKWQVKYKKENETDWKTSNSNSFIIDEVGNYRVKIANNNTESNEKQIKAKSSLLPSEFQEVEYIESTGTQYIDTGVKNDINFGYVESKFQITSLTENIYYVFGCYSGHNKNRLQFSFSGPYFIGIGDSYTNTLSNTKFSTKITTVKLSTTHCMVDNEVIYTGSGYIDISDALNIHIFECNNLYYSKSPAKDTRIYSLDIYNNLNVPVRNFIPCYRESDNKPGLYDLVNNEFYTNQGTGDFEKGNDINSGETINKIIINNM